MIYFKSHKKDMGMDFIHIAVPENASQLKGYYDIRKSIFCDEQGLFKETDYDGHDEQAIPIVAVNHYLGTPDKTVGIVRIYEESDRHWFGGRLGIVPEYRSFSRYVCPRLFGENKNPGLCQMSIAAGLIYRAVSLANHIGCDKFSAHVQEQNVRLFERLHWHKVKEITIHGLKHVLMEADLKAYPAMPPQINSGHTNTFIQKRNVA